MRRGAHSKKKKIRHQKEQGLHWQWGGGQSLKASLISSGISGLMKAVSSSAFWQLHVCSLKAASPCPISHLFLLKTGKCGAPLQTEEGASSLRGGGESCRGQREACRKIAKLERREGAQFLVALLYIQQQAEYCKTVQYA